MGRILIDTRDIRGGARDLRSGLGSLAESRANINSVFRGSWLGPNGGGFASRWDQELAAISQVGHDVERIAADLDGYASRVDSEQRLGSRIRSVVGWTLRTGANLVARVARFFQAGWNTIMGFLVRIANLIREALAFIAKGLLRLGQKIYTGLISAIKGLSWGVQFLLQQIIAPTVSWVFSAVLSQWWSGRWIRDAYFARWAQLFPCKLLPDQPTSSLETLSPLEGAANTIKEMKTGEFEIRDNGKGQILVLLRGMDVMSQTANSTAEVASETGGFGPYSAQVEAAIRAFKLEHYPPPKTMEVSFVGHSQGGIVARNILGDKQFWKDGIKIGTVITIESPVDGRTIPRDAPAVYQFNNSNYQVSKFDIDYPTTVPNEVVVNVGTTRGHDVDQFNRDHKNGTVGTAEDQKHWAEANQQLADDFGGKNDATYRYQRP